LAAAGFQEPAWEGNGTAGRRTGEPVPPPLRQAESESRGRIRALDWDGAARVWRQARDRWAGTRMAEVADRRLLAVEAATRLHAAYLDAAGRAPPWTAPPDFAAGPLRNREITGASAAGVALRAGVGTRLVRWERLSDGDRLALYERGLPPAAAERADLPRYRELAGDD